MRREEGIVLPSSMRIGRVVILTVTVIRSCLSLLERSSENLCDIARGMFVDVPLASQFLDEIVKLLLGSRQRAIEPVQQ